MTVDSVTDNGSGNYTIAYTGTVVLDDVLALSLSKTKYDFSTVPNVEIIIPA
jgi:hypothetical protein